jgi:hypothetical protein
VLSREEVLSVMATRATEVVPEGQPIIPNALIARTEDLQSFRGYVTEFGYSLKFGTDRAFTRVSGSDRVIQITARCSVGELTDEFLHAWNNWKEQRGRHLEEAESEEHRFLSRQKRFSGSSNDRRFHQLELKNYVNHLRARNEHIPIFVWKTFVNLAQQA